MATDLLYLRAGELVAFAATSLPDISRAFVALDAPALDCPDTVTVHINALSRQALSYGVPLSEFEAGPALGGAVSLASFVITVVRCAPRPGDSGERPPPIAYENASQLLLTDLWTLWKAIPPAIDRAELWQGSCQKFVLGPVASIPESGGFAGWTLALTAEVSP